MTWIQTAGQWIAAQPELYALLDALWKLALAALLGGIIGFEREHSHRPAGFRTHILVSVGAALVMLTSVYVGKKYAGTMNVDITRMSGQVISGIGFLGAGTILREGFSVKGLTTAASLWAVSCVGIAVGAGYVAGAIIATIAIYITLNSLKKVLVNGNSSKALYIEVRGLEDQIPKISKMIKRTGTPIHSVEILYDAKRRKIKETMTVKAIIFPKSTEVLQAMIANLQNDENVVDVYVV